MEENFEKIRPALVKLEVGETVSFPISRLKSVRTQASELGAILGRQYTTKTDRERKVIVVLRSS
jgi:hypothetical protein